MSHKYILLHVLCTSFYIDRYIVKEDTYIVKEDIYIAHFIHIYSLLYAVACELAWILVIK